MTQSWEEGKCIVQYYQDLGSSQQDSLRQQDKILNYTNV